MIQLRPLVGTNALVNFVRQYYDAGPGVFQYFSGQVGAGGVPSMYEDFTTGQALDPRITFSRTSNATLTGSNGLIQYAPHNLLTYSEQFDNAYWLKQTGGVASAPVVTANVAVAPDGTTTADQVVFNINGGTTSADLSQISATSQAYSAGQPITQSVYLRTADNSSKVFTFVSIDGVAQLITVTGSWQRFVLTVTPSSGSSNNSLRLRLRGAEGTSQSATIFMWGAQLEIGSTATTYNPTTVKNLLGYTQEFDNAAWTKSNSFVQTNLLTYSQDFDNAAWTKNSVTPTANATTAPDGSLTADLVNEGTASAQHYFYPAAITATTGTAYTASVYMKQGTVQWMQIPLNSAVFGTNAWANFDLVNGVVGNVGASATATITPAGNGWFRCTITSTATASTTATTLQIAFCGNTDTATRLPTTTGANLTVYVWGAQLVQGSSEGNYTATYSAAKAVMYPAPDGSVSADKLVENTATSGHYVLGATVSLISGTPYTGFVYAKAAERTQVVVQLSNAFTSPTRSVFDLSSGTVVSSTASVTSATITPVGNGWYLCGISSVCVGVAAGQLIVQPALSGNISYTGDGTSGIYIWGAQLSDSASVDPYVYNPVAAPSAAAYYGPRFDYDPITLAPKGLLIEEQRTNLLTYSEQFDNAAWTKSATTVTANSMVAPDGTVTADTLTSDGTSTQHNVNASPSLAATTAYAFSVYAKAGATNFLQITTNLTAGSANHYANFDLQAGTVSAVGSSATATIQSVGNGWYRCTAVMTTVLTSASATYILIPVESGTATRNPTFATATSVYIWGAQLEAGAFATSYIPTVASQVTRSADIAQMLGANFSNWYNQSAGTMYVETAVEGWNPTGNNAAVSVSAGSAGSSVITTLQSYNGTGRPRSLAYNSGGGIEADMYPAPTVAPNVVCKQALAIALNDYALSKDGAAVIADTSATVPTVDRLVVGAAGAASSSFINGWVKRIAYYNRRLANSELQGITA